MTQLVKASNQSLAASLGANNLSRVLTESGYFKDIRSEAQAIVKVLYGEELGITPVMSMMSIHIIEGKPSLSANLIATLIKRSGKYTYRVTRWDNKGCELLFIENGVEVGPASFVEEDAKAAGLLAKNVWKQYAKSMYFARAVTLGARTYCADIFGAAPVYTAEELGGEVDSEGNTVVTTQSYSPSVEPMAFVPGADSDGVMRCKCGVEAAYVKAPSGNGWMCGQKPRVCSWRLKDATAPTIEEEPKPAWNGENTSPGEQMQARKEVAAEYSKTDDADDVFEGEVEELQSAPEPQPLISDKIPFGVPESKCRGCGAVIFWMKTKKGLDAPFNADGTSHFSNCPNAPQFRNARPISDNSAKSMLKADAELYHWASGDDGSVNWNRLINALKSMGIESIAGVNLDECRAALHKHYKTTPVPSDSTESEAA